MKRALRGGAWALAWLLALGYVVWAFGALYYDFPLLNAVVAWAFALAVLVVIIFAHGARRKLGATFFGFALVLAWWITLKPSNEPPTGSPTWRRLRGRRSTATKSRCTMSATSTTAPRPTTRRAGRRAPCAVSQITGIDLAINYWGSPWMAHPIASFQFADAPPVCFSIETRKKVGQSYSAIGGLYRQFELIYIVADERDVIRVRTNYRHGEDIYLYRTTFTPAQARERFHEYLRSLNQIHDRPRWYNAITTNCTTTIRDQHPSAERMPWDWRILLNGKGDELMFERHTIATDGLPFAELKQRALINPAAQAANDAPDFSRRIRKDRPGF